MHVLAPHYQIELTRDGRMDMMTIKVESASGDFGEHERKSGAAELSHHVKSVIGISVRVEVLDPGGVERSAGKARRVIDLRKLK